jgi:hypothetical protein
MDIMDRLTLDVWLNETAWHKPYWCEVENIACALHSDGCTGVVDWFVWTCWEHDIHYRTHKMLCGCPLDWSTANYILRVRIQQSSWLKHWSPLAWIRYWGVQFFLAKVSKQAWNNYGS